MNEFILKEGDRLELVQPFDINRVYVVTAIDATTFELTNLYPDEDTPYIIWIERIEKE